MSEPNSIDGVLVQWGERLFYPGNRIVKVTLPRSAGRFERDDRISLIAPTQDSGLAIASILYE